MPSAVASADRGNLTYPHPLMVPWGMQILEEIRRLVNPRTLTTNSLQSAWQVLQSGMYVCMCCIALCISTLYAYLFTLLCLLFMHLTDTNSAELFETACKELLVLESMLPAGMKLVALRTALLKKIFHARCGATFRKVADLFTKKATVHLRERLKGLSADKQAKRKNSATSGGGKSKKKKKDQEGGET